MNHKYTCPYFTFSTRGTTIHYELYEHANKAERPTFVLVHGFYLPHSVTAVSFLYYRKKEPSLLLIYHRSEKVISLICLSILITI